MNSDQIVDAIQRTPKDPSHIGNPLLENLFDFLSPQEFFKILIDQTPRTRAEILEIERDIRPHFLDEMIDKFLVPNRRLYQVYELIHSSINASYKLRNPIENSIKSNLRQDFKTLFKDNYQSTFSKSSLLVGISGIGKTTSINVACALFKKAIRHTNTEEPLIQIPIIKIECPKDGSLKDLCRYFFIEVDNILGTSYEHEYCKPRDNASDRVIAMSKLVAAHCVGTLIVDEIQHLNQTKSGGSDTMLNFFLHLDNTLHIPILIVGTPEALELFSEKQRLRRRFTAGAGLKWDKLPHDAEWSMIIKHLFKYQYTDELANININWADIFYFYSQGIIDRAIKLFVSSQKWAFSINAKSLTIEIINKVVAEMMWLDEPMFKNIRDRNLNISKASDMMLPDDVSDFKSNYRLVNIQNELEDFNIPKNFYYPMLESSILKNPSLSDNEIAYSIIKKYRSNPANSSESIVKRQLTSNYIDGDLRKIKASNQEELHKELLEQGDIVNLSEFMN
ncbi:MAG: ATP-binding protein [Marinoscillum sp.]